MGSGQRVAMSAEVTHRCTSCSAGVRKAPQMAHRESVGEKIGTACGSVVARDRAIVTDRREEARRPAQSRRALSLTPEENEGRVYAARQGHAVRYSTGMLPAYLENGSDTRIPGDRRQGGVRCHSPFLRL